MNICTVVNIPSPYKEKFNGATTAEAYNKIAAELFEEVKREQANFVELVKSKYPNGYLYTIKTSKTVETGFGKGLLNTAGNLFVKGFKLKTDSAKERSTLLEQNSPVAYVKDELTEWAGKSSLRSEEAKNYDRFISWFTKDSGFATSMNNRLNGFLAKNKNLENIFTDKPTVQLEGSVKGLPQLYINGRVLNLTAPTVVDGKNTVVYDTKLLETATLATANWLLNTSSLVNNNEPEKRAAGIFKINEEYVTPSHIKFISDGFTAAEAIDNFASKIQEYWGVSEKSDARVGYSQGVVKSLAAEILTSLEAANLLQIKKFDKTLERNNVQVNIYQPTNKLINEVDGIIDNSLLDKLIINKQIQGIFVNSIPAVSERIKNSNVPLSALQKAAQAADQRVEHKLHKPFYEAVQAIGTAGMALFNEIPIYNKNEQRLMNVNHAISVDGSLRQNEQAFKEMTRLNKELEMVGEAENLEPTEIPVRYKHETIVNGRSNMQGPFGPQANKWMRHMMMPTFDRIPDIVATSSEKDKRINRNFRIGIAQALGVSVHNLSDSALDAFFDNLIPNFEQALKAAEEWLNADFDVELKYQDIYNDIVKNGLKPSPMALFATIELQKMITGTSTGEMLVSPVYVEADGTAAGPGSAMYVFANTPTVNKEFFKNLRLVGFFLGSEKQTLNEERTLKKDDLYGTIGVKASESLKTKWSIPTAGTVAKNHIDAFKYLIKSLSKDIKVKPDGTIDIGRGAAKNPTTITIYGSGAMGISRKVVDALMENLYEALSEANIMQASGEDGITRKEALQRVLRDKYGSDINVDALLNAINVLSKNKLKFYRKSIRNPQDKFDIDYAEVNGKINQLNFTVKGFLEYTLNSEALERISENVKTIYVDSLVSAIEQVVGVNGASDGSKLVQKATNIQSIFLQHEFEQEYKKLVSATGRSVKDGISPDELRQLEVKLRKKYPYVNMGNFVLDLTGRGKLEGDRIGSDLTDNISVTSSMHVPKAIGVGGAPQVIISTTDAQMVALHAADPKNTNREIRIYDGIHLTPSDLQSSGEAISKATFTAWNTNVYRPILDSYSTFLNSVDTSKKAIGELPLEIRKELYKATGKYDFEEKSAEAVTNRIFGAIDDTLEILRYYAVISQARIDVLQEYPWSIDHMAATSAPYQHQSKQTVVEVTDELIVEINKKIEAKINDAKITGESVNVFVSNIQDLTPEQKIVKSVALASPNVRDYKVRSMERPDDVDASVNAVIDVNKKEITFYNVTPEVVTHELVHAATYENIVAYYNNSAEMKSSNIELYNAITRLDLLLQEYLKNTKYHAASLDAFASITNAKTKAAKLNEFMAWGLSNEALTKELKQQKTLINVLAGHIKKGVYRLLLALGFDAKSASFDFGSLLFNATIVATTKAPSLSEIVNGTLNHSYALGSTDRLNQLAEDFDNLVIKHIVDNPNPVLNNIQDSAAYDEAFNANLIAQQTTKMVEAQFYGMSPTEQSAFYKMVYALATSAKIDPSSMIKAQEMYNHVIKNLDYTDFLVDPETQDQQAIYDATQKFKVLVGELRPYTDKAGRSTLVPVFLALAQTNPEFQAILTKMPLPEKDAKYYGSVNSALTTIANTALTNLGDKLANQSNQVNVLGATTALVNNILDIARNDQNMLQTVSAKTDSVISFANDIVAKGLSKYSDVVAQTAGDIGTNTNSKLIKAVSAVVAITATVANEQRSLAVMEDINSTLNKSNIWLPFKEIVTAIIGRTKSNGNVYDLVKRVRAMSQQTRQHYREDLPATIARKFSRKLTNEEWAHLYKLAKTDIAGKGVIRLVSNASEINKEIVALEAKLKQEAPQDWALTQKKAKQLAEYMNTGVVGQNLLTNARTVSMLLNEVPVKRSRSEEYIGSLDNLISLYALQTLASETKTALSSLVQEEKEGIDFVMAYLVGQRKEELNKVANNRLASLNYVKGYIPRTPKGTSSLQVMLISDEAKLTKLGYVRVADYADSGAESGKRAYYYLNAPSKARFTQGIIQNIKDTAGGVHTATGTPIELTAGHVLKYKEVLAIKQNIKKDKGTLVPIFDADGNVRGYWRALDPKQTARLDYDTNLAQMIGNWRGRQVEEIEARKANEVSLDHLVEMWNNERYTKPKEYVNILDSVALAKDPILADAVKQLTYETINRAQEQFGQGVFMVRKDLVDLTIGYRSTSIGDAWTGNSRVNPKVLNAIKSTVTRIYGQKAYETAVNYENIVQNLITDAKVLIVVKSVIVPVGNAMSTMLQLAMRGVPLNQIITSYPRKINEITYYTKTLRRNVEIEAELRATTDIRKERALKLEQQTIKDSQKRLSIWSLIEAGEFSAISDVNIDPDDVNISDGRLHAYMEKLANKLPGDTATIGKYALITKDTALFKGMERAVQYGDFLGKAVLYDYYTQTAKLSKENALAQITDEFVNYDIPMGRTREYLDHMGIWWFSTFKLRSIKTALSIMQRNPLHALLAMNLPFVSDAPFISDLTIGNPIADNLLAVDPMYSIGPHQAINAANLNPWFNIVN